jgi:uncharacterized SAM-binding protein YcdF (DUF218 family)
MHSWQLTNALAALLIPPGLLIVLMAGGLALRGRYPRLGFLLLVGGLAGLYVCSTPITAHFLLRHWEGAPTTTEAISTAQVIIVLGGGKYPQAPEYGGDTVAGSTLVRLRYAAHLHRLTGQPIMVSGGSPEGSAITEALVMRRVLEREFGTPVRWAEDGSANTLESALLSYRALSVEGIRTICLVTHAWHMPRAQLAFERAGFRVIPAATAYATRFPLTVLDFLPNALALRDSAWFFHEVIGTLWYRVRLLASA